MVREILKIRTDNGLGDNNPTFKGIELTEYNAKFPRMGMPSLSATLKWATPLDDEWTGKEYVTLRGERFYIRHTPSGKKDNQDARYNHELEFTSEFAEILGNTYFEDAVPSYAATYDKPCSNSTKFTFYGTIAELVDRLNCSFLKAGIGDSRLETKTDLIATDTVFNDGYCVMLDQLGAGTVYDPNKTYEFSFEDKFLWEAITYGYETTEIPFERRGKKIIFGAIPNVVTHKFEYGHDNALLSVYHKNANAKVINRITMLGSSENIPYYYPNETEYGHISIAAKSGNEVLTADHIQIANMTQLLSRLNADDFAILCKYDDESEKEAANALVSIGEYAMRSYDEDEENEFVHYIPDTYKEYRFATDAWKTFEWPFRVNIEVLESGYVKIDNIYADVWFTNSPQPTEPVPVWNVTVDSIRTVSGQYKGDNIKSNDDGSINLGYLEKGEYTIDLSVIIKNKTAENLTSSVLLVRLQPITAGVYKTGGYDTASRKEGYYWAVGDKKYDGVGALGVKLSQAVTDAMIGDGFGWVASGRMPFQDHLVPPKYRNTLGDERFYNALNDTYTDPDTGNDYVFPNPFVAGAPSEYIHKNEEIKPTIEDITNAVQRKDVNGALMFDDNGNPIYQLLGEIADIAYDADDNDALKSESTEDGDKNDTLKYEHSFFYIKLNIFNGDYGFDLFAHASQTDAMALQMRDGSCNGCKFKIQAVKFTDETGLESYKNPIIVRNGKAVGVVSEDGIKESDLDPKQQNTQTHSIWICVQKDASTFGVIMPNKTNSFKPKIGDKFNIINIDLPQPYILFAEQRLEEDGIRFMADNNEEKFTFDIQASRIFFAENPQVLAQLDEYSVIKVKYNGKEYEQYVNQLTIDCKDSEALPNIGIDLTDTLAVGQSFVDQVAERASSLIANPYTMGGALGGGGGLTTRLADQRYLKKTESDRSVGKVASDVGFEVGEFVSGASGGIFYRDPVTGQTYLEVDKLKARMKAIYAELEVAKESSIGGAFDITPGGGIDISFVEELTDSYRCYFKAKEEDKGADCRFVVGDQARCKESNISNGTTKDASNRYYWRLVTAVNNDESYIELSKTDRDHGEGYDSDAPMVGDTVVQLGNRNNAERQSAIVLSTVDAFAPCVTLYNGIDNYSLDGKSVVEYGVDKTKNPPEPFFNCYGRFFFGPRSRASFLEFNPTTMMLEYKGILHIDSKIGDKTIENYVKEIIPLDEYDYLKQALWQDTTITNGLVLTSAVSLGYKDNNGVRHTTAGMSGVGTHPKSIASWWGGNMVDKYYDNSVTPRPTPLTDGYAQALIRMDGSGYFAGGNIRWTEYGAMTFGSGILIDLGGGKSSTFEGIGNSLSSLTLLLDKFVQAFVPIVIENGQKVETTWGSITSIDDLYAVKSVKGFFSEEFISAKGMNPDGSSGGGASQLRMLDDVQITDSTLASGQALVYNGTKWVNQTVSTGLNTTQLADYLTTNNYAKKSDIPSLDTYAKTTDIQQWVEGKNYLTDHQDIFALTLQAGAFSAKTYAPDSSAQTVNIPTKTSHLINDSEYMTLSHLTSGLAAKLSTYIFDEFKSGYDTWKANVDDFMTMFVKESDGEGGFRIKALFGLYTEQYLSARGNNPNGSAGGGNFGLMRSWPTSAPSNTTTEALGANLGWELKQAIDNLPTTSVNPYALTIQKNGTTLGSYDGSSAKTINITDVASAATLSGHTGNGTIHITANERTLWNQTATNLSAILGADSDTVINKWEEVVAFLDTYTEADTLANLLGNKADKTTKISAGTGLSGGGTLASDRTLSLATSGVTAGTYTKLTVDAYGRATAGASLVASDIPTLAISKIDGLQTAIDGKVSKTGDTMTGTLKITNGYLNLDGNFITHLDDGGFQFLPKGSLRAEMSKVGFYPTTPMYLGMSDSRWHTVYTTNVDVSTKIKIGDCEITWDADAGMLKFSKGLYSLESVSARGANSSGGSAGGGLIQNVYNLDNIGQTFSKSTLTDTFNAHTIQSIYNSVTDINGKYLSKTEASSLYQPKGNYLTGITKAQVEGVLTGNITSHTHSQYLTSHQSLANYVTVDGAQLITGFKKFKGGLGIRYEADTSNALGFEWYATDNTTVKHSIIGHNTANRIIINPNGSAYVWSDAVGKYSLIVGANELTYNTYPILTSANISSYAITSHQSLANYVTLNTAQTITALKTYTAGLKVSGRIGTGGDDEGIVIGKAGNNYAGLILGDPNGVRSIFYLTPANITFWRYNNGTASYDIGHPSKSGTIALTSDISSAVANYLPLTGGTLTGTLMISTDNAYTQLTIFRNNNGGNSAINFQNTERILGNIGICGSNGTYPYQPLFRDSEGNDYKIFHSGNDGAGSGLDADLLDGLHYSAFARADQSPTVDLNTVNGIGMMCNPADATATTERHYPMPEAGCLIYCTAAYSKANQIYGTYNSNRWFARSGRKESPTAWREFAFLDDNVASATKLNDNTAYKAWGKTFFENGVPKTVSGDMTGVGNINYQGEINLKAFTSLYARGLNVIGGTSGERITSICGVFGDNDSYSYLYYGGQWNSPFMVMLPNGNVGIGTTTPAYKLDVNGSERVAGLLKVASPSSLGNYNQGIRLYGSAKDSTWSLICFGCDPSADAGTHDNQWLIGRNTDNEFLIANRGASGANGLIINADKNVGIGREDPAYKLDVNGSVRANGWIRTIGQTGWYNETYGGGWYMSDSGWIRTYNNKSIYAGSGTIRTDGSLQVGESGATFIATNGGNVGINNTAPAYALDVNGTAHFADAAYFGGNLVPDEDNTVNLGWSTKGFWVGYFNYIRGNKGKALNLGANNTDYVFITTAGNVGFGTSSPSYKVDVIGVIHSTTGIFSDGYMSARGQNTSDMRIKNRLEDIELDLDVIVNTPIFNFKFKDTGKWSQGTSAQYMEKILPSTVFDSPECLPDSLERIKSFDYGRAAFIYNVVSTRYFRTVEQELREEIRKLKEEIAELKAR